MTNEHAARPRRIWEGGAALIFGRSLSRAYNGWGIVEPFNDNRGGGDCGIINTHMGKRLLERNQSTKGYSGKACGITGAACGIGKAFALYAAEKGMRLALIDIDDRVEDVRKEYEAAGSPKALAIGADVSAGQAGAWQPHRGNAAGPAALRAALRYGARRIVY